MGIARSGDSGKYFSGNTRKVGKTKIHRNRSGCKSGRNPATTDAPPKIAKVQKWGSSEVAILEILSENTRKVVKLEKWKFLVTVVGGNLAEIQPLLTIPRK